jgi:hypothetical protein
VLGVRVAVCIPIFATRVANTGVDRAPLMGADGAMEAPALPQH